MTDRLARLEALAKSTLLAIDQLRKQQEQTQLNQTQRRQAHHQMERSRKAVVDAVRLDAAQMLTRLAEQDKEFRSWFQAHIDHCDRILDQLERNSGNG